MRGLNLASGLFSALLFSTAQSQTIYDTAPSVAPKNEPSQVGPCSLLFNYAAKVTIETCTSMVNEHHDARTDLNTCATEENGNVIGSYYELTTFSTGGQNGHTDFYAEKYTCSTGELFSRTSYGYWYSNETVDNKTCPPDTNPDSTVARDTDEDGEDDSCYNPNDLDNASNCAANYNSGKILPASSSAPLTVCQTNPQTGASCAYNKVSNGQGSSFYEPALEQSCFGTDDATIPEYQDPNQANPNAGQCIPYGAGGFACAADPAAHCTAQNVCDDGCGYVNNQFICFRAEECVGNDCSPAGIDCAVDPTHASCAVPPADCTTNPNAAECQVEPTPENCLTNPTLPGCNTGGNTGGGGGGGSSFVLDYDRLINGMKDASKLLIDEADAPEFKDTQKIIDDRTDELDSQMEDFMNDSVFNDINSKVQEDLFGISETILPTGASCTPFTFAGHSLNLCPAFDRARPILYFVFAFFTFTYLMQLFFSTVTPTKE